MSDSFKTVCVILAVLFAGYFGYTVHEPDIITVYNNTVKFIEVPVIVTDTVTEIVTIETTTSIPIYINNTEIHYMPTPMPLMDFPSKAVLLAWMWTDDTDTLTYDTRWTCMDFTLRTIRNAESDGYRIYFMYQQNEEHAVCMAYVEKEAQYVIWEPQTDKVKWTWESTQGGSPQIPQ